MMIRAQFYSTPKTLFWSLFDFEEHVFALFFWAAFAHFPFQLYSLILLSVIIFSLPYSIINYQSYSPYYFLLFMTFCVRNLFFPALAFLFFLLLLFIYLTFYHSLITRSSFSLNPSPIFLSLNQCFFSVSHFFSVHLSLSWFSCSSFILHHCLISLSNGR